MSVEVLDTGIGIAEEMLEAIFAEYHQVAPGFGGGVGLGLFIVKRGADMLGHSVAVRSKVGIGSSFAIEVPLHLDAM
ncbi:MAG TPA: ATP-binding protein [Stellaceae bacterium]|nr:ATP-binding protein [Stellaceae bacterium]